MSGSNKKAQHARAIARKKAKAQAIATVKPEVRRAQQANR